MGSTCSLRATSSSKALVRGDRLAFLKPLEGLELGPSRSALKSLPCTPMVSNLHTLSASFARFTLLRLTYGYIVAMITRSHRR